MPVEAPELEVAGLRRGAGAAGTGLAAPCREMPLSSADGHGAQAAAMPRHRAGPRLGRCAIPPSKRMLSVPAALSSQGIPTRPPRDLATQRAFAALRSGRKPRSASEAATSRAIELETGTTGREVVRAAQGACAGERLPLQAQIVEHDGFGSPAGPRP